MIIVADNRNNYREEVDAKRVLQIREITRSLPQACSDFIRSIAISTSTLTRLAYAIDLNTFFTFLHDERIGFAEKPLKLLNDTDLEKLTRNDIIAYTEYLTYYLKNSDDDSVPNKVFVNHELAIKRKLCSIKNSLSREQFMLYRLIYNRYVASQMCAAVYETMAAEITDGRVGLHFYGEHKVFAGFTTLYEEGTDEAADNVEVTLPALTEGQKVSIKNINADQHFTQPPSRYTEASLVRTLEENGIGRPSTYAPTITTIIARGYVSREKKRLFPTQLGIMVTEMMEKYFSRIVDTEFTAIMEEKLDEVEEGKQDWKQILRDFYPEFEDTLSVAEKEIEKVEVKDDVSDVPCDKCGTLMVYKMGKFGRFLACPNFPDCRNTMPILKYINASCPQCGGRLLEKTSRKNRRFYGCERYPECDFISWDKPADEKCPQCGHYMIEKRNNKGETIHLCTNESCRYKTSVIRDGDDGNE